MNCTQYVASYSLDKMRCRGKAGKTRREHMLHFDTPPQKSYFTRSWNE